MKRARTKSIAQPALQFKLGTKSIYLSHADVDQHEGSLLHSLVETLSTDSETEQHVCVDLDSEGVAESPLSTWSHGLDVAAALYRYPRPAWTQAGCRHCTFTPQQQQQQL